MIRAVLTIALLAIFGGSSNAQTGDLSYNYRPAEIAPLKGYDGQPYWRLLAQCAGVHGTFANRYGAAGQQREAERSKTRGVEFLRLAEAQLRRDRGLAEPEIRLLSVAAVEQGRDGAEAMLAAPTASGYTHAQLADLFCNQISQRHKRAARGR